MMAIAVVVGATVGIAIEAHSQNSTKTCAALTPPDAKGVRRSATRNVGRGCTSGGVK
jgi:hypothetical protein